MELGSEYLCVPRIWDGLANGSTIVAIAVISRCFCLNCVTFAMVSQSAKNRVKFRAEPLERLMRKLAPRPAGNLFMSVFYGFSSSSRARLG